MRKIKTEKDKQRESRRNMWLIGGVLILLMVFSTLGFAFNSKMDEGSSEKVDYNGIQSFKQNDYWVFNLQGYDFITTYNHEETKDIIFINSLIIQDYANQPLYLVGEQGLHFNEIGRNLDKRFVLRISYACLNEEDCEGDLPIKDCKEDKMIVYQKPKDGEIETITQEDNCIFITANPENSAKYADVFLFDILGIR
ncbi:MAG: hypothetical protein ABIH37_03605 [archaeon]